MTRSRLLWQIPVTLIFGTLSAAAVWWSAIGWGDRVNPRASGRALRIVVMGDSLGAGYGAPNPATGGLLALLVQRFARKRPGTTLQNVAIGGSRIDDLERTEFARVETDPDAIVVVCGGNDLKAVATPLQIAAAIARLLEALHGRYPRARVVVADLPDVSGVPEIPASARIPFHALIALDNLAFRRSARAHGAATLPLYDASRSPLAADPRNFFDGEHPSALGYQRLAALLWPAFKAALDS